MTSISHFCRCGNSNPLEVFGIDLDAEEDTEDPHTQLCKNCLVERNLYCEMHGACIVISSQELQEDLYGESSPNDVIPVCLTCVFFLCKAVSQEKITEYAMLLIAEDPDEADTLEWWSHRFLPGELTYHEKIIGGCCFFAYIFDTTVEDIVSETVRGDDVLLA